MNLLRRVRLMSLSMMSLSALVVSALLLASCAPNPNAQILSPSLGAAEVAQRAGEVVVAVVEEIPYLVQLAPEEVTAGLAETAPEVADALASANPENGPQLALNNACAGCHVLEPDGGAAGPVWYNLGNVAVERALDTGSPSPAVYLYNSIAAPNAYVVDGYNSGVMPQNYTEQLSPQDFADLLAYILEQQQETPDELPPLDAEEAVEEAAEEGSADAEGEDAAGEDMADEEAAGEDAADEDAADEATEETSSD